MEKGTREAITVLLGITLIWFTFDIVNSLLLDGMNKQKDGKDNNEE